MGSIFGGASFSNPYSNSGANSLFGSNTSNSIGQFTNPIWGAYNAGSNLMAPNWQAPTATMPTQDPNITGALNNQVGTANAYSNGQGQKLADQQYGQSANSARQQLAKTMKQTNADYNQRGLLRSGMAQTAQYGNQANYQNQLANNAQQIQSQMLQNQNQLNQNAVSTGGTIAGLGTNLGGMISQAAGSNIAQQGANNQMLQQGFNQFGSGAGSLAGTIAANNWGGGGTTGTYSPLQLSGNNMYSPGGYSPEY
jgi:hypothetical protein